MKQTLQLKLTQHLTLTPQLQQSIRLLQLSTLELNAEVERMLQENPLLEKAEGDDDARPAEVPLAGPARAGEAEARGEAGDAGDNGSGDSRPAADAGDRAEPVERADFDDYSAGESDWSGVGAGAARGDDDDSLYPQQEATSTLRDHLYGQLAVLNLPLRDRQIVAALIDAVDEDGYLADSAGGARASSSPRNSRSNPTRSRSRSSSCRASSRPAWAPATRRSASRCS